MCACSPAAVVESVVFFRPLLNKYHVTVMRLSLQVERLRSAAEVSLIFFYAPWCAHSMAARQEVQLVAKKLAKQVQDTPVISG